jgi:hypothetical protein
VHGQAAFAGHDGPEPWVDPTNQHPNEIAHEIAGQALHHFLAARSLPRSEASRAAERRRSADAVVAP